MKLYSSLLVVLAMLMALIPNTVLAGTANNPMKVDLIAGQHIDAGEIQIWNDNDNLYVKYSATPPWCLDETHLQVASNISKIPQNNGNPVPGQFEYKSKHNCVSEFTYTVPLTIEFCDLYIAAHAVVKKKNGSTETAWGNGNKFPGKNWATYFVYSVDGCTEPPSSTPTFTKTSTLTASPSFTSTSTPTPTATSTVTDTPVGPTETYTPTSTATFTPTSTPTTSVCQPSIITADFSQIAVGESVEGLDVVAPNLNIDAIGTAVKIMADTFPTGYISLNDIGNEFLPAGGGFTDMTTKRASQPHQYTFTFAPGTSVSNFSLHMLDYGDYNPSLATSHYVSMTAYDANDNIVSLQEVQYTTEPGSLISNLYGDLKFTGDATASPGQLGNWTWNVSGSGIVKVVLEFGIGFDPAIGFDELSFIAECSP